MTDHILGVDISKANLDVHLMPTGETQQFANSTVGFRRLIAWLRERPVSRVVYEPTGPWHRDFERALGKAGLSLSRVNPLQARRFAQALGQKAKTDAIDARILAAMGRVLDLPRSRPSSQWQTELRELHAARQALTKDRTATLNRQKQARLPLLKRQCASRLRHIERQLKALEAEMAKHVKADPAQARAFEILNSIPGISVITAIAVLSELPEIGSLDPKAAGEGCARRSTCRLSQRSPAILTWPGSIASSARPASRRRWQLPLSCASSCCLPMR